MPEVLAGLSSVLTATLGGVISSGVITYVLGARRAERELLRGKLERLYIDISRDIRMVHIRANRCCEYVLSLERGKNLESVFEEYKEGMPEDEHPSSDVYTTIINIYFPRAAGAYKDFLTKSQEIHGLRFQVGIDAIFKPVQEGSYQHISTKLTELVGCAQRLHTALLHEADKLNCPLWRRLFLRKRPDVSF